MDKNSKIYIAGHRGLVGSAIWSRLEKEGYNNLIGKSFDELDLRNQQATSDFFKEEKPEYVFLAAAKVGGIQANDEFRADFINDNIQIQSNIINSSYNNKVKKLLFLGSSCIYPKNCPQPIKEEYLLTGELEHTNEPYAVAKIAGLKTCAAFNSQYGTNYISVMPTNLYGLNDNFDLSTSHVIPALIRKFHEAKIENKLFVEVWGTGKPKREFLYSDDLANACIFLMKNINYPDLKTHVNIGTGEDLSIKELAELIQKIVGYSGDIKWNTSKPDGTERKLLDVTKINNLGWKAATKLRDGLTKVYENYG
ncbi:GDP-L-fucose synthase [Patescibacteria group bacterium]|nr:GDP-L-fucose synthase [Patescibacteria group bacterium]MBU1673242.1 GDP-L-fucose synthase [Patescibacteria group bacterium]MBU1963503.1 GDP-L-fucose synthase [Patescibacteria group bacterium]